MYTRHYGLREKPFSLTPDPRYLYLSSSHREALAHLLYGIEQGEGFSVKKFFPSGMTFRVGLVIRFCDNGRRSDMNRGNLKSNVDFGGGASCGASPPCATNGRSGLNCGCRK